MQSEPLNIPDDLLVLAQQAIDASAEVDAAKAACMTAMAAREQAITQCSQRLSDLANALGSAGITSNFQHAGFLFQQSPGSTLTLSALPPDLADMGPPA